MQRMVLHRRMTEISDTRTRNTRWPCILVVVVADERRVVGFCSIDGEIHLQTNNPQRPPVN